MTKSKKINKKNIRGIWNIGVRESASELIKSKELNAILLLSL